MSVCLTLTVTLFFADIGLLEFFTLLPITFYFASCWWVWSACLALWASIISVTLSGSVAAPLAGGISDVTRGVQHRLSVREPHMSSTVFVLKVMACLSCVQNQLDV